MLRSTDKDDLYKLFPLPSKSFTTRGMHIGIIIKFQTFYLKIYDHESENAYMIQGYRYHEQDPVFEKDVHAFQLREFASQFTQEDYLMRFQHCSCNSR